MIKAENSYFFRDKEIDRLLEWSKERKTIKILEKL